MSSELVLLAPLILIGARLLWQRRPGLPSCALFWGLALVLLIGGWPNHVSEYLLGLGVLSNAAVTLANGGFMPVALRTPTLARPVRSLWVQRRSGQRLLFLADNFGTNFFRFSVGDVLLLAGIVLSFFGR